MTRSYRCCASPRVAVFVLLFFPATAFAAAGQDDTTRGAARASGYEGIQAFEKGDMATAVDKLGRAFGVVKVPTLGLWYARALAKTGKLVEAAERYGEVIRLEVTEGKVKEQKMAQADAAAELDALKPRIPSLTMNLIGAGDDYEITMDGKSVPAKLAGMPAPVNPGTHRIRAQKAEEVVEQSVTIAEGEKKSVELRFDSRATSAAKPLPKSGAGVATGHSTTAAQSGSPPPSAPKGSSQKTIGWITLGVGGVATAAGVITGILALSKRRELDDSNNCTGTTCYAESDRVDSLNQFRLLSTVGFIVGAVGIGAGTTLLLTAPKPKEAAVSAWIGVGSVGLKGSF